MNGEDVINVNITIRVGLIDIEGARYPLMEEYTLFSRYLEYLLK